MKTVAASAGHVHPGARALIEAAQDFLAGKRLDWDSLQPITPAELAAHVADPAARKQIVHGMVTVSLVDEVPPRAQTETIRAFAAALGVADGMLETVDNAQPEEQRDDRYTEQKARNVEGTFSAENAPAKAVDDAHHWIEAVPEAPFIGDDGA